ncbi:MAG: hypothetical protein H7Y38_19530 [Armatimonadetes bacterium]|nr:hypothetical protein [Armatimonadota bacterium]
MKSIGWIVAGVSALALTVAGCVAGKKASEFPGEFAFLNKSGMDAYEMTTNGFAATRGGYQVQQPGAGRFASGTNAYMSLGALPYPAQVTVIWGYKSGVADQSQVVDLSAIAPADRKGTLVFEFQPDKKWTARFDPAQFPK